MTDAVPATHPECRRRKTCYYPLTITVIDGKITMIDSKCK